MSTFLLVEARFYPRLSDMLLDGARKVIEAAGLRVVKVEDNPQYQFISDNAKGASKKFGVKSVSLLAQKS